jgi:hypothetical protein
MRLSSSFVRIVLVGIITAMSVSFARADSIIAVTGPSTCPVSGCGVINTLYNHIDFGFNLPSGGLGQFVITNETIFTWKYLSLTGPALAHVAGPISCSSNLFANCSVSTFNGGGVRILFSGLGSGFTGILPGENFSFTFGCSAGPCTWKGNQPIYGFMASTTATPEPGTIALMLTGIAAIAKARRLKMMGKDPDGYLFMRWLGKPPRRAFLARYRRDIAVPSGMTRAAEIPWKDSSSSSQQDLVKGA